MTEIKIYVPKSAGIRAFVFDPGKMPKGWRCRQSNQGWWYVWTPGSSSNWDLFAYPGEMIYERYVHGPNLSTWASTSVENFNKLYTIPQSNGTTKNEDSASGNKPGSEEIQGSGR